MEKQTERLTKDSRPFKFNMPKLEDFEHVRVDKFKIEDDAKLRLETLEFLRKFENKKKEEIRKRKQEIGKLYKDLEEIEDLINTIRRFKILEYY